MGQVIDRQFFIDNHIDKLINSFATVSELYSVVLDINGKILLDPFGPAPYMGEFYELVRNPAYYNFYTDLISCIIETKQVMYSEIEDGNPDSRLAGAPIYVNGRFVATWILYAHSRNQNQKLFKTVESMQSMSEVLSDIITKIYINNIISNEEESIKTELEFERNSKEILESILQVISTGERRHVKELYDKVGQQLDIDYIVYYEVDNERPGYMKLVNYWSKTGKSREAEAVFVWDNDHYSYELQEQIINEGLVIDKSNMTNRMRVEIFEGKIKAIMVNPVYQMGKYIGRLVFIESSKERIWTENEKNFAKVATNMFSRDLAIRKRIDENGKSIGKVFEAFDDAQVMFFVRRQKSGRVLFANKAFIDKVGEDITGKNSFQLVPHMNDEIEAASAASAASDISSDIGMTKYQRYIERLGGIYNIIEQPIEWSDGGKASIIIMREE